MSMHQPRPLRGRLLEQEPMARHTSWRVGGPADHFYQPADLDDLVNFVARSRGGDDLFWLGLGSNLLVRDGGLRQTVISTSGCLNGLDYLGDHRVRAEVGVACPKLARDSVKQGHHGLEFLSGIPGTVGGALAMNAGCLGSETWQWVESVQTLDRQGRLHTRAPEEFEIRYRHVSGVADEWFVAATFQLQAGEAELGLETIRRHLARRSATQPTSLPNAGSVFRNPPGDHAARLIEHCGLKNHCIGGACVSEKHANFIINTGTATASDIEALIEKVWQTVKDEHGIALVREVHIVGEAGGARG